MTTEGDVRAELARSRNEGEVVRAPAGAAGDRPLDAAKRPDGTGLRLAGQIMIVVALLAGGLAWGLPDVTNAAYVSIGVAPTYNPWKWPVIWSAVGFIQFGVLLWLVGTIIHALYFLPGREISKSEFIS